MAAVESSIPHVDLLHREVPEKPILKMHQDHQATLSLKPSAPSVIMVVKQAPELASLPSDLLVMIFSMLSHKDLCITSRVSKRLHSLSKNERLWQRLYEEQWGTNTLPTSNVDRWANLKMKESYKTKNALEKNWSRGLLNSPNHVRFEAHAGSSVNTSRLYGNALVTTSDDASIKIWELPDLRGETAKTLSGFEPKLSITPPDVHNDPFNFPRFVFSVDLRAKDNVLVSGGSDECLWFWNSENGKNVHKIENVHKCGVYDVRVFEELVFSCGGRDTAIKAHSLHTGKLQSTFWYDSGVYSIAHSADDSRLLVAGGSSGSLRYYDTRTSLAVKKLRGFHPLIAVHIDRQMIVCGDQEGSILFYDLRKAEENLKVCPSISIRASIRDLHFDSTKLICTTRNNSIHQFALNGGFPTEADQRTNFSSSSSLLRRSTSGNGNGTSFVGESLYCVDFDDSKLVCGERNGWVNVWDFDSSSPPPSSYLGDSPAYCSLM